MTAAPYTLRITDNDGRMRSLKSVERELLIFALAYYPSRSEASRALGVGRSTFYRMINHNKLKSVAKKSADGPREAR